MLGVAQRGSVATAGHRTRTLSQQWVRADGRVFRHPWTAVLGIAGGLVALAAMAAQIDAGEVQQVEAEQHAGGGRAAHGPARGPHTVLRPAHRGISQLGFDILGEQQVECEFRGKPQQETHSRIIGVSRK